MAKGNMLQGMARGKVGDVVFSRLNGEQISRVRNRNPKNPRTNAQLYQRAIMATVMQAYSAGKVIFDHAFEGKAVGAENQRRFMALNAKHLREQLSKDLNRQSGTNAIARVIAPGYMNPVATPLIASEGTYQQTVFTMGSGVHHHFDAPAPTSEETVKHYAERIGLIPGDIYTFCGFVVNNTKINAVIAVASNDEATLKATAFGYVRMTVRANVLTNDTKLTSFLDLYDVESGAGQVSASVGGSTYMVMLDWLKPADWGVNDDVAAFATIIRSRKDQDLRSKSEFEYMYSGKGFSWGITVDYLLETWKQDKIALGNSDLVLEGGKKNGVAPNTESGD